MQWQVCLAGISLYLFHASDSKYIDDFYGYYNLGSGTTVLLLAELRQVGDELLFLASGYSYDNKYMATVTGRYDGSSKFGQNNKYAFFRRRFGLVISMKTFER